MRQAYVAVLEQDRTYEESFSTEPWEVAWATEARWFLNVTELVGSATALVELSPDGRTWCGEGTALLVETTGLHSVAVRDFGPWLRLRVELDGTQPRARLFVYLALKG